MTQGIRHIDVDKTYLPIDPNSYPRAKEDEFKLPAIYAFDGHNFMPTGYGYKSYFGLNGQLNIDALTSRCDAIFIYQDQVLNNVIYALCEDGIWTKDGTATGAWSHAVTLSVPAPGVHKQYTWCVIENSLYIYRQGEPTYWFIPNLNVYYPPPQTAPENVTVSTNPAGGTLPAAEYTYRVAFKDANGSLSIQSEEVKVTTTGATSKNIIGWDAVTGATGYRIYRMLTDTTAVYFDVGVTTSFEDTGGAGTAVNIPDQTINIIKYAAFTLQAVTPTFLNMGGQIGIFRSGSRLGFWDSENSVAWASLDDFSDFMPSISTFAGNAKFNDVHGIITAIHGHGEGFIIYATKSITLVVRSINSTMLWDTRSLLKGNGVAYPEQIAVSSPDTRHFAWTPLGIVEINNAQLEYIIPEMFDFLKESNNPVYLQVLEGRFLFFKLIDGDLIFGKVIFSQELVEGGYITFNFGEAVETVREAGGL